MQRDPEAERGVASAQPDEHQVHGQARKGAPASHREFHSGQKCWKALTSRTAKDGA